MLPTAFATHAFGFSRALEASLNTRNAVVISWSPFRHILWSVVFVRARKRVFILATLWGCVCGNRGRNGTGLLSSGGDPRNPNIGFGL
jgi:hypothetical protein